MNTKLIIGVIIGLLIIGSINRANAQYGGCYRGQGASGYYGPPRVSYGGCNGGYYGGGYGGGYGYGGCGYNNYSTCQTAVTLGGIASIIGAVAPIVCTAIQQPTYVQQPQQPQVIYIQR